LAGEAFAAARSPSGEEVVTPVATCGVAAVASERGA
jgi:hypothetical protein